MFLGHWTNACMDKILTGADRIGFVPCERLVGPPAFRKGIASNCLMHKFNLGEGGKRQRKFTVTVFPVV